MPHNVNERSYETLRYLVGIWWCTKIISKLIVHTCVNECTWRTKEKNQSKGTGGVLANYPPKVKSEESSNKVREYELWRNCAYLAFWGPLGFYSNVELTSVSCVIRRFLMEKIVINGRILWDPPYVRILFVLRLCRLGLIVRRKLFPFRISWRSLKLGGCHVAFRSIHYVSVHFGSVLYQPTDLAPSSLFKWICHP